MKARFLAISTAVLAGMAACDSGAWVDVGGVIGGCKGGKPDGLGVRSAADVKLVGQQTCAGRQKNYAGEFQCKGTDLQVKCK